MDQVFAALDAAWRVLIVCLLLGAGLPALYTVALRQLAVADGSTTDLTGVPASAPVRKVLAYVLIGVVIVAILLGLAFIMAHGFGYKIGFDPLPTITKK